LEMIDLAMMGVLALFGAACAGYLRAIEKLR
jgi:hypothetical protein